MIITFLGILQIISSFVGGQMMDNRSKKMFLIVGELIMAICLYAIYKLEKVYVMVILLIFVHTIAYRFSVGPLYNYYASKMLKKTSTITITNWSMSFVVALISQFMMENLGIGNMCISYCVVLSCCIAVLIKGVPSEA